MPAFFSEGNAPKVSDTRWRALEKILGATIDGGGGGGGASTNYQLEGHGVPVAPPADTAKLWTYFDLDDGRQEYLWSVEEQSWGP